MKGTTNLNRCLSLASTFLCGYLVACASVKPQPYPITWPQAVSDGTCLDIDGVYENATLDHSGFFSKSRPEVNVRYLSGLLETGTGGVDDEVSARRLKIRIDGTKMRAYALDADANSNVPIGSIGRWACREDGRIVIAMSSSSASETAARVTRSTHLLIGNALDGSLVVLQTNDYSGLEYGLIPSSQSEAIWMRFLRSPSTN